MPSSTTLSTFFSTTRIRTRRSRLWFSILATVLVMAAACAPPTFSDTDIDQVPDINRGVLEVLDAASAPNAAVDAVVNDFLDDTDTHGCAIGITEGREVAYLQGYGVRQFIPDSNGLPFTVHTRSPIGSISKTVTSLAAMALVERGDLSLGSQLDEVVGQLPPGLPANYRNATLEDLLSHRAGVQYWPAWASGDDDTTPDEVTAQPGAEDEKGVVPRKAIMGLDTSALTTVAAGTYSNLGYLLVGAMIDEIVSAPGFQGWEDDGVEPGYEAWVWTVLNSSSNTRTLPSAALNHGWREDGDLENFALDFPYNEEWGYFGWEGPAGGWTMTIGDLSRLVLAVRDSDVVSADSWNEITTSRGVVVGSPYGLGLIRPQLAGELALGHGGSIYNYRSAAYYVPLHDLGIAVMCNQTVDHAGRASGLATDIAEAWVQSGSEPTGPNVASIDPAILQFQRDGLARVEALVDDGRTRGLSRVGIATDLRREAGDLVYGDEVTNAILKSDPRLFAACVTASLAAAPDGRGREVSGCEPEPECPPGFGQVGGSSVCVALCVNNGDGTATCPPDIECPDGWIATEVTANGVTCKEAGPCPPGWVLGEGDCVTLCSRSGGGEIGCADDAPGTDCTRPALDRGIQCDVPVPVPGCPDGFIPTPEIFNPLIGECIPNTLVPPVHVSCLAGNGRLDVNVVNGFDESATYTLAFGELRVRTIDVKPLDWGRFSITGRRDGNHRVVIERDGIVLVEEVVRVHCDDAHSDAIVTEPEVTVVNACRFGNGYILVQMVNPSDTKRGYVIEFERVRNRSTTAQPHGAALRAVTGRPDGEWNLLVRTGSTVLHTETVTVRCD